MKKRPTVVLIHGLFGFNKLLWFEYFQGVKAHYEEMGLSVFVPSLPWSGSIKQRANALADQLQQIEGPLHIIAHSMGGLDARFWITHLGGACKTETLTTLVTPHRGSPAANYVCSHYSPFRLFSGVRALTTEKLAQFNIDTPDHPDVDYFSYSAKRAVDEMPWIVRHYGRHIQNIEGDNDSQVSLTSAHWGEHIATLPCDHFELIFRNFWLNPFRTRTKYDPMPLYHEMAERIVERS